MLSFSRCFLQVQSNDICWLGLFSKDDFAERPMNKITTFQISGTFLASLVDPLNRLNATVVSKLQGCFKQQGCFKPGGVSLFGLVRPGLSLFVLFGTFPIFFRDLDAQIATRNHGKFKLQRNCNRHCLFLVLFKHLQGSRKVCDTIRTFPEKKWEHPTVTLCRALQMASGTGLSRQ